MKNKKNSFSRGCTVGNMGMKMSKTTSNLNIGMLYMFIGVFGPKEFEFLLKTIMRSLFRAHGRI